MISKAKEKYLVELSVIVLTLGKVKGEETVKDSDS